MNMTTVTIVLNVIALLSLLIPAVRGYIRGFVRTAVHLLRFFGAFVLSCVFSKPIGALIKEKWLGEKFYDVIWKAVSDSFDGSAGGMADAVPSGLRTLLETFGFDVNGAASNAALEGEAMLESFTANVSDKLAGIASVAIAFVGIFVLSLLVLALAAKILTVLVEKIPLVRGLNRILGLGAGLLIGVLTAWTVSQFVVFILTTFTSVDYSQAVVLNFFHDISPLRWILQLMVQSMTGIAA
ncbi:MAG: hypothetical protein E7609_00690 [Ruminococcaceae bacterium]|nr:hypothetical protein [Oscillospiraceae bacterium]